MGEPLMPAPTRFEGKVGLQQRVLPSYRVSFVDLLARACTGGLEVFAGKPEPEEAILHGRSPRQAQWIQARNLGSPENSLAVLQPGLVPWIRRWKPDALVLEANPRYLGNWGAPRVAQANGARVIGWGLGAPNAIEGAAFRSSIWRWYLGRFDALISYSSRGASEYERCGFDPDRVFVAHNAALDGPAPKIERSPAEGRSLRVLFVGRLQGRKRVDDLLRACAELRPKAHLKVVGDGPARGQWEHMGHHLLDELEFTGALEGDQLRSAFNWADLFVLPGTGGLAIQEAMAHGLPVVAAKGDGTQEDLVRPENGWLVEPDDFQSLRSALVRAQANPRRLLKMGEASRRIVAEDINLNEMVTVFIRAMVGHRAREHR
jgi:glycosyltransferase involved in cell wall biosynthesis